MEQLSFLTDEQVRAIRRDFGTPVFVYDRATLERQADQALAFPNAFGLTARFAMKALPNAAVIRVFAAKGFHIDASSEFECLRALRAGVPPHHIQLTAQELPRDMRPLLDQGVLFNACSLEQLRAYGQQRPGSEVSIRMNPGRGSGHSNRTNVGGPSASFGIWHEQLDYVFAIQREFDLRITRMHTHIGSGTDPDAWEHCARLSLGLAARLPEVTILSLGGGFKVGRMAGEKSADLAAIGEKIKADFEMFEARFQRRLHVEIEPGTFLVANAGAIVCTVTDIVSTGVYGYTFLKTDSGMTEVLRPSMYGAQHPIAIVPATPESRGTAEYIVVGHCCESGDVLTVEPANPEVLKPRTLLEAKIGDALVIGGAGAYCSAMSAKNYNSFPEAPEVMRDLDGAPRLIRKRQTLDQILINELND